MLFENARYLKTWIRSHFLWPFYFDLSDRLHIRANSFDPNAHRPRENQRLLIQMKTHQVIEWLWRGLKPLADLRRSPTTRYQVAVNRSNFSGRKDRGQTFWSNCRDRMECGRVLSYLLYGSVASLPLPSSNIEAWPYGTSLRSCIQGTRGMWTYLTTL